MFDSNFAASCEIRNQEIRISRLVRGVYLQRKHLLKIGLLILKFADCCEISNRHYHRE
jgi:hypothetical protein